MASVEICYLGKFNYASKHQLDNLIIIIDYNKLQALSTLKDILPLNNLSEQIKACM